MSRSLDKTAMKTWMLIIGLFGFLDLDEEQICEAMPNDASTPTIETLEADHSDEPYGTPSQAHWVALTKFKDDKLVMI